MKQPPNLLVKDVATLTGISVRTLHYYEEINLITPARSAAGYRLYDNADLLRLQQILIGRTLGLSLEEIRRSLDDPAFDQGECLKAQRARLVARVTEMNAMVASIDAALAHITNEMETGTMDLKAIFGGFDPSVYEAEAAERWGETDAFKQSAQRSKAYGEAQWRAIKVEQASIFDAAAEAMKAGSDPGSAASMALAERHRCFIDRWFYPLSPVMHATLADMWEADSRFEENIDRHGQGLTRWLAKAVRAAASASRDRN
ncbi:MAG TPA: MerR family transcriptional regulator, partial [Rhizomicrobium sp.]|nr:MerR family transcriptional regulator [Rhizomicrobium sp.]